MRLNLLVLVASAGLWAHLKFGPPLRTTLFDGLARVDSAACRTVLSIRLAASGAVPDIGPPVFDGLPFLLVYDLGTSSAHGKDGPVERSLVVALFAPVPLLVCVASAWPLALRWSHARTARVRASRGECVGCGYDLRGTPGHRCPECGRPSP